MNFDTNPFKSYVGLGITLRKMYPAPVTDRNFRMKEIN
jgi:hypothetical protein